MRILEACLSLSIVVLIIQPAWQQLFSEPSWQFTPLFQAHESTA